MIIHTIMLNPHFLRNDSFWLDEAINVNDSNYAFAVLQTQLNPKDFK